LELGELAFFCCCDSDTDNRPQEHKKEETGSFIKEMSLSLCSWVYKRESEGASER
jgi:hypothetical protein